MRGIPPGGETDAQRSTEELLVLARSGDGEAFRGLVEPYRHERCSHARSGKHRARS